MYFILFFINLDVHGKFQHLHVLVDKIPLNVKKRSLQSKIKNFRIAMNNLQLEEKTIEIYIL